MANCTRSAFQPFIEWSSHPSHGIITHVIDVLVGDQPPDGFEATQYFGTLSFIPAPLALPPLWLDDVLGGSAVDPAVRRNSVLITIGLSNPIIRLWLRFMKNSSEVRFVSFADGDIECAGSDTLTPTGTGNDHHGYRIELTKGTEIHIPTAVGIAAH